MTSPLSPLHFFLKMERGGCEADEVRYTKRAKNPSSPANRYTSMYLWFQLNP